MGDCIVYIIGVFDLIHTGHLNIIDKASALGRLVVGVVSDEAVNLQKGSNRPVQDESTRINIIKHIKGVEKTCLVKDFDIYSLYKQTNYLSHMPNLIRIAIKGEDQNHIKGFDKLQEEGFYIITLPRTPGVSTSQTIQKMENK